MDTTLSSNKECRSKGEGIRKKAANGKIFPLGGFLVCTLFFILDQASKLAVERNFEYGVPLELIPGVFSLTYVINKGAAWGIFAGQTWLLLGVALVVVVLMAVFWQKLTEGYRERVYSMALILSGVLGNTFDRIWREGVVDFLDVNLQFYRWPIFNIADCAISIGAAIYVLSVFIRSRKESDESSSAQE